MVVAVAALLLTGRGHDAPAGLYGVGWSKSKLEKFQVSNLRSDNLALAPGDHVQL